MNAINTVAANNLQNAVNPQGQVVNQTVGTADFMAAFAAALKEGQENAAKGQSVDFAQLLTNLGEGAELVLQAEQMTGLCPETVSADEGYSGAEPKAEEFALTGSFHGAENDVGFVTEDFLSEVETNGTVFERAFDNVPKETANRTAEAETVKADVVNYVRNDAASTGNNEISAEIAKKLIMTGNAKDFSAGYLSLISQSDNAADLQTLLSAVGTLEGSVSQSLGLINAIENGGILDFVGLPKENEDRALTAEQLVMLTTLAGASPDNGISDKLIGLLLDEDFGGEGRLDYLGVTALLGGFSDFSAESLVSMMSGSGGIYSMLSALEDDSDKNGSLFEIGGFSAGKLTSGMLVSDSDGSQGTAVPVSAAISMDSLKQLANVWQRENLTKLEALANAFENGDATVAKTESFVLRDVGEGTDDTRNTAENAVDGSIFESDGIAKLMGENELQNVIREVKRSTGIKNEGEVHPQTEIPRETGFDENRGVVTASNQKIRRIDGTDREPLGIDAAKQTAEQISAKLNERFEVKETFSVKLTPEGLGDVAVNLEKTEDGIVLSLVADKPETAKLLNSEIGELQSALSRFDARINEIRVGETAQNDSESFLRQDFSEQFEQNRGSYKEGTPRYRRAHRTVAEQAIEVSEPVYRNGSLKINTYI